MSDLPAMPPKIAEAIATVMGKMERLSKSERNKFSNYNFAGIDAFLDAVRPACAEAGLFIIQDEGGFEVIEGQPPKEGRREEKSSSWLKLTYLFTLAHRSGEICADKIKRTIMVNASMGSQAFGAAQSYAQKNFMRSLFQISTGEQDDADHHPQENLPAHRPTAPRKNGPKVEVPKEPGQIRVPAIDDPKARWKVWGEAMAEAIDGAESIDELDMWMNANDPALRNMGFEMKAWADRLVDRANERRDKLVPNMMAAG